MDVKSIVSARIHPAIGIARVGNSPDEYIIGPELPYPVKPPKGGYKDAQGRLKREAARFRIYGYDVNGNVVGELTAAHAEIAWTVHVANKKAAWYDFDVALDIPEASSTRSVRRNASITGADRAKLVIDPGPRTIRGGVTQPVRFDTGRFFGEPVYLGELRSDKDGRLIVLGGHGVSGTAFADKRPATFANNAGWHDDIADGPVSATVTIKKRVIPVDSAWVVSAPPNYAPDIVSPQTMFDVVYDALYGRWFKPYAGKAPQPSFTNDILPLLRQLTNAQWVNYGFMQQFGWHSAYDFDDEELLRKLSTPPVSADNDPYGELRLQLFYQLREPGAATVEPLKWPPIYGDAFGNFDGPRVYFTVTKTTYGRFKRWMQGDFVADYDKPVKRPANFDDVPLADQPATLDKAALHWCMGGPFHPGCEMTWPMRQVFMYRAPFRLRERPHGLSEPEYGEHLDASLALSEDGPLSSSGPGDISKWMAVPWQTDTASCRSGYPSAVYPDPYIPTFWPSRVPNDVMTAAQAAIVMDESKPIADRRDAFNLRKRWLRGLDWNDTYVHQITKMVEHFGDLGVVEARTNTAKDELFPATLYVEEGAKVPAPQSVFLQANDNPQSLHVSEEFAEARFGGRARRY